MIGTRQLWEPASKQVAEKGASISGGDVIL
jgi:hypothetical protein